MFDSVGRRMTDVEAGQTFLNNYVLMRRDSDKVGEEWGEILWVGDNEGEAYQQLGYLEDPGFCTVITGEDRRQSWGSIF